TTQSPTLLAGTFSAQCAGGITVSGEASGQLGNSQNIPVTVQGTGTVPGIGACPFMVTGTGSIIDNGTALQIGYSGTTCVGPIHGTETLRKKTSSTTSGGTDTGSAGSGSGSGGGT